MATENQNAFESAPRGLNQERSRREHAVGFGEHYNNDRDFGDNRDGFSPKSPAVSHEIRPDNAIQNDILDLFRKDDGIEHWSISVSVKDGTVLLTGHVKDEAMRVQAEFVLKNVQGVLEVRNDLHVPVAGEETEDLS